MINLSDNANAVRLALNRNDKYRCFIKPNNVNGKLPIQVGDGYVMLFHNLDDTFDVRLMQPNITIFQNNSNDISRISGLIERFAFEDYRKQKRSQI